MIGKILYLVSFNYRFCNGSVKQSPLYFYSCMLFSLFHCVGCLVVFYVPWVLCVWRRGCGSSKEEQKRKENRLQSGFVDMEKRNRGWWKSFHDKCLAGEWRKTKNTKRLPPNREWPAFHVNSFHWKQCMQMQSQKFPTDRSSHMIQYLLFSISIIIFFAFDLSV